MLFSIGLPSVETFVCRAVVTFSSVANLPKFALMACLLVAQPCWAMPQSPDTIVSTQKKIERLSTPWIENKGQWDSQALFRARSFAGAVWITKDGKLVHQFNGATKAHDVSSKGRELTLGKNRVERSPDWVLTERFAGGKFTSRAIGVDPQVGTASYLVGHESTHAQNLASYGQVQLGEVFPGVSVALKATNANVEKLFTVAPHRDPKAIRMAIDGAQSLTIGIDGSLIARTGNGDIAFTPPIAFQEINGQRNDVGVSYELDPEKHEYGFVLAAYDRNHPITIDPLLQSTYLGGTGWEAVRAIAIHPRTGDVYVVGETTSTDFPGALGGARPTTAGGLDAFVARFNAALTTRLQSTYIGGAGEDAATAIAIHPTTGDVYVAGYTASTDFPGIQQATAQKTNGGGKDGFVSRLSSDLTFLQRSTYLGGSNDDLINAVAIHPLRDEIYVTGETNSIDFPVTASGSQASKGDSLATRRDAFVSRFNVTLSLHRQSTYLGAERDDIATSLAIHPWNGAIYVAGVTDSKSFPNTAGGALSDATGRFYTTFLSRFGPELSTGSLIQSTYIGESRLAPLFSAVPGKSAIAIHPVSGEVYIFGVSDSTTYLVPALHGGALTAPPAARAYFVLRINEALTRFLQSTYLGRGDPFNEEAAVAIAIHPATQDVYVSGITNQFDIPGVANGFQATSAGGEDAFVSRLNKELTRVIQSTYLGGSSDDRALAIAIHPSGGEIYVAGYTNNSAGPTPFPGMIGAPQPNRADTSLNDAFVSRLSLDLMAVDVYPDPFVFNPAINVAVSSIQTSNPAQITGTAGIVPISIVGGRFAQYCISGTSDCGCNGGTGFTNSAQSTFLANQYVCVRQVAPDTSPALSKATLIVGGRYADYIVTTGTAVSASQCSADIDGNGSFNASTDGLLLTRAMLGMTGTAVTSGAIGAGATRNDWATIRAWLNANCGTNFAP